MAFSAVVLPAPFGPMIPTIRPSSTRRSMPSSATVVPNAFRRPRASMHDMASALLVFVRALLVRALLVRALLVGSLYGFRLDTARAVQQFLRVQAETLNHGHNPGPFFLQKLLAL